MSQTTIPINENLSTQIKESISGEEDSHFLSICETALTSSGISFQTYLENIKKNSTSSACSKCYKTCSLAFKCMECQNFEDSVLCLECFLKGHHEGHNAYQILTKIGTCDCGNPAFIKPSGFCSDHQGEISENELTADEKSTLFTIFDTLLFEITHTIPHKSPQIEAAFQWMLNLASTGDTAKRCCSLAFAKNEIDFEVLQFKLIESVNSSIAAYNDLIMSLANDPVFLRYYTKSIILFLPNYVRKLTDTLLANPRSPIESYSLLQSNFFLAFTPFIHDIILKDQIDWYTIFYDTTDRLLDFFKELCKYEVFSKMKAAQIFEDLMTLAKEGLKVCLLKKDNQTIPNFIKRLPNSFVKYEALFHFMRQVEVKIDDFTKKSEIALCIHNIFIDLIKEMYELYIFDDYPFEQLVEQVNRLSYQPCSVLSTESVTIPFFPLHILTYFCLLRKKLDIDEFVLNECQQHHIATENLVDAPLKFLATANLSRFDLFVRNSDAYITTLESAFFRRSIARILVPTFAMVQLFFAIEPNKNSFLKDVATIFGLYQRESIDEDSPTQSNIEFCAILFICCLIFDRYCFANDLIGIKRLIVISHLKKDGAIDMEQIKMLLWGHPLQEKQFKEDLLSYATVAQTPNGSHLKLSNDLDWQPLLPFIKPNIIFEIFSNFTATNKDALIRFPEYTDLPFGLDVSESLTTPTLFAFEYHLISQYVSKESTMGETLQLLFNLLIKTKEITRSELTVTNDDKTITASDMLTLMDQLPTTFPEFMNAKISYKNREAISMIDMIKQCQPLGFTVLNRLNVKYEVPQEVDKTIKKERKSKAKAVQDNIIAQFKQQQDKFASNTDEVELTDECPICLSVNEENPVLVFPISTFHTMIPMFVNNKLDNEINYTNPNKPTYQRLIGFHLCGHFFHKTCIAQFDQKHFKCPIDRCLRNNFLPKIEKKFKEPLTEKEIEANTEFINRVFKNESLNTIIHSVTGELSLLEVRFRSRPEILDRSTNRILFHYLFVSLWYQFHESSKQYSIDQPLDDNQEKIKPILKISPLLLPTQIHRPKSRLGTSHTPSSGNVSRNEADDDDFREEEFNDSDELCEVASMEFLFSDFDLKDDPVAIVVFKLLQSDTPTEGYNDLINKVFNQYLNADTVPFELKYQFLRRVAMFQHFALDLSLTSSSFIDWDDLLSFESLAERYQINLEGKSDIELPMFSFIELPKSFLSFYLPPYSIKVLDDETKDIGICLLTGEVVNLKGWIPGINDNGDIRITGITQFQEFRSSTMCNTFSICLALTGKSSSIPFILDQSFKKKAIPMKGFYVDSFGNEDRGQTHGDILTLNEQKLDNLSETLLSSDWIDQMPE